MKLQRKLVQTALCLAGMTLKKEFEFLVKKCCLGLTVLSISSYQNYVFLNYRNYNFILLCYYTVKNIPDKYLYYINYFILMQ